MYHLKEKVVAPDCRAVYAGGELDMSAAAELRGSVDRALELAPRCLVVDLSEATFVDSTSIGILVAAHQRLQAEDGSLVVVCANRNVRRTFEIAGIDRLVTIRDLSEEPEPVPAA